MFAKRIMTNIRLTYDEGAGDFPVDNDFRRIGIIQDPYDFGTTDFADSATLRGTYSLVVTGEDGGRLQHLPAVVLHMVRLFPGMRLLEF